MKKKVIGGVVALLILIGIAGSHNQPATSQLNLTPASNQTLTQSTEPGATTTTQTSAEQTSTPPPSSVPTQATPASAPASVPSATPTPPASNCNPNYTPCITNSPTDLDCPDIHQRVTVIGTDVYRLDADHDGIGCESY